jgi:hypothetical protein
LDQIYHNTNTLLLFSVSPGNDIDAHQLKECRYRTVKCPYAMKGCRWKDVVLNVYDHLCECNYGNKKKKKKKKKSKRRKKKHQTDMTSNTSSTTNPTLNKFAIEATSSITIKCCNNGCDVVGSVIVMMKEHPFNCIYRSVECTNIGCHVQVPYHSLTTHLKVCDYRPILCKHKKCQLLIPHIDLMEHERTCDYNPIKCHFCGVVFLR